MLCFLIVNKRGRYYIRAVFLRLDVNVLIFYSFPKSFNPNVVFGAATAVHADPQSRVQSAGVSPFFASATKLGHTYTN